MEAKPKVYFTGIEDKILDYIEDATHSIVIMVAWFTSKRLKDALLDKKNQSNIDIQIVVDDNVVNKKHFYDYQDKFHATGIKIRKKIKRKFLHNKFIVFDEKIILTGSYNFSNNAKSNSENIVIIENEILSHCYLRQFKYLTQENYVDENILILFEYPEFAQDLVSTNYKFLKKEYLKYENKIRLGYCFMVPNGIYDEIRYSPGFIFNPKIRFEKRLKKREFELPISKEMIKAWTLNRNIDLTYQSYSELGQKDENFWDRFGDDIQEMSKNLEAYFKKKLDNTYNASELRNLIKEEIDIIMEDGIWTHNFEPFFNAGILDKLFSRFDVIKKRINFIGTYEEYE